MLDDITLLDFTQSIAGPTCTEYLGALGANIIKVEPPTGDPFRRSLDGAIFAAINQFKRSVGVDLKTETGPELAASLAEDADVVVESFRPGVLEEFGLDYDSIREVNEDVVYCSITGFGQDGPYRDRPAYDPIVQAMSGIMHNTGYPDRPPVRIGTSPIDFGTGAVAALLILGAIRNRDRSGKGEYIDVSLYDVGVSWMSSYIAKYSESGEISKRSGQYLPGFAPMGVCYADDEPFFFSAPRNKQYRRLCSLLGLDDLGEDERFQTLGGRWEHRDVIEPKLEAAFSEYDREELVELLNANGIPAGPIQNVAEVVDEDPHVAERNMLTESHNLIKDVPVQTSQLPFYLSSFGGRPESEGRPPVLGEHTIEVLCEQGYSTETIEVLFEDEVVYDETNATNAGRS